MIQIIEERIAMFMSKGEAEQLQHVLEFYRQKNGHLWHQASLKGTTANFITEVLNKLEDM